MLRIVNSISSANRMLFVNTFKNYVVPYIVSLSTSIRCPAVNGLDALFVNLFIFCAHNTGSRYLLSLKIEYAICELILPFCSEIGFRIFAYENYEHVELTTVTAPVVNV